MQHRLTLLHRGFNEVTSPNGVYYQSWSNGKPTVNTGSTGLGNFGEGFGGRNFIVELTLL